MAVLGFSPAPKYAVETPREGKIKSTFQKYYGNKLTRYEQAVFSEDARELGKIREKGDTVGYQEELHGITKRYNLTPEERKKLRTTATDKIDPYVRMFKRFPWQRQKLILDEMTPEERKKFLQHSNKAHLQRRYEAPEDGE